MSKLPPPLAFFPRVPKRCSQHISPTQKFLRLSLMSEGVFKDAVFSFLGLKPKKRAFFSAYTPEIGIFGDFFSQSGCYLPPFFPMFSGGWTGGALQCFWGVHKAHRSRTFPPMSCAIVCTPRHSPACPWNACPVSAFCPPPPPYGWATLHQMLVCGVFSWGTSFFLSFGGAKHFHKFGQSLQTTPHLPSLSSQEKRNF